MVPRPGSTGALRRHSKTSDSEKGGLTMLKTLLMSLALLAVAVTLAAFGGGLRGMGDGGLRFSAGTAGFGDGGLNLDDGTTGMGDGGL